MMASNADKAAVAVRGKKSGGGEVVPQSAYGQLKEALEKNAPAIGRALAGQNAEAFEQSILNAAIANPEILSCDVRSIVGAALICAQTGLQPGPQGYAFIVPYNTKENGQWRKKAQFQYGYKGLIKLAYRTGDVASIDAIPVYRNDEFKFGTTNEGQIWRHIPAFGTDRGELMLVLSVVRFKDGRSHALPVEVGFINSIRDMSKGYQRKDGGINQGSPWAKHYLAMAQKTAIKQHFKTLELSDDFAEAVAADERTLTWTEAKAKQVEAAGAPPTALKDETPWDEAEVEVAEPYTSDPREQTVEVAASTDAHIEVDPESGEVLEGEVEEEPPGMDAEEYRASLEKQAQAKMAGMNAGEQAGVSDDLEDYVEAARDKLGATLDEDVIPPATKLGYTNDQARDRQVKSLFVAAKTMEVPKDELRSWVIEQGVKHTKQLSKQQVMALIKRVSQYAA